ncbi:alpha/beta hydrolase [Actinotalea solisilvae]|uniref:alpha/beta hydrolase n=1 Tax=Actinotalea solisilvae TaxID=2072922 RepID=UPI0018F12EF8|nr:alpha/beta fold hydrolase [Actinotalea solisilvae]
MRSRPRAVVPVALVATAVLAACSPSAPPSSPAADAAEPGEYRPGRAASTDLPAGDPDAVVVLVPGGGWATANPGGLAPLADALVADGLAVVTITYGTSSTDSAYPEPADDVVCAIAYAATQVPDVPVVAVGHSAGAHLALLAALAPERAITGEPCPHPAHPADGVVGLAGPYDVTRTGGMARDLFGASQTDAPEAWADGNPLTWAAARPDLPVLLVHGDADDVVPTWFTTDLAADLEAAGHDVRTELLPGVDHMQVIRPEVVGDLVAGWVHEAVPARP